MANIEKKKGNSTDDRNAAKERRAFIVRQVRLHGRLEISDIEKAIKNTDRSKIQGDIDFFHDHGLPYQIVADGTCIIDPGDHVDNVGNEKRSELNAAQKGLVADLALSLIVGFPEGCTPMEVPRKGGVEIESVYHEPRIFHDLTSMGIAFGASDVSKKVKRKWIDMLHETSRMVAIDAGTTNEVLAGKLSSLMLPVIGSNLNYLTVCTNSRNIFQVLGQSDVPIRTVVVGGQQRGRSSAIAGALAEAFVRTAELLHFGCAIIGATSIDTESGYCYADTQEDAIMKGLLLGKSAFRVIIADDSKLGRDRTGGGYAFCALHPRFVDLVITSAPLDPAYAGGKAELKQQVKIFPKHVNSIVERDVAVLVATKSGKTIDFQYAPYQSEKKDSDS